MDVVESFKTDALDQFSINHAALIEVNPHIVYASICEFDERSSYEAMPSFDMVTRVMNRR